MNQQEERPRSQKISKEMLASLKSGLEKKLPQTQKNQSKGQPNPPSAPPSQMSYQPDMQGKGPQNGFPFFPPMGQMPPMGQGGSGGMQGQMNMPQMFYMGGFPQIDSKTQQEMKSKGMWPPPMMMPPFMPYMQQDGSGKGMPGMPNMPNMPNMANMPNMPPNIQFQQGPPPRQPKSDGKGYEPKGYQSKGYQPKGYQPKGYQSKGYQPKGYQSKGYQPKGYQSKGYQPKGYQSKGYDPRGFEPSEDKYKPDRYGKPDNRQVIQDMRNIGFDYPPSKPPTKFQSNNFRFDQGPPPLKSGGYDRGGGYQAYPPQSYGKSPESYTSYQYKQPGGYISNGYDRDYYQDQYQPQQNQNPYFRKQQINSFGSSSRVKADRCKTCGGMILGIYKQCDRCARSNPKKEYQPPLSPSAFRKSTQQAYQFQPSRGDRYDRYNYTNQRTDRYQGEWNQPDQFLKNSRIKDHKMPVSSKYNYSSLMSSIYEPRKNYMLRSTQEKIQPASGLTRSRMRSPEYGYQRGGSGYDRANSYDNFSRNAGRYNY